MLRTLIFTLGIQVYIIAGGKNLHWEPSTTETLEKDGGSAWKVVARLPGVKEEWRERYGAQGLGLDNGRFIVTGQINLCLFVCKADLEGLMLFVH